MMHAVFCIYLEIKWIKKNDVIEELTGGFQLSEFADLWEGASTVSAITCGQLKIWKYLKDKNQCRRVSGLYHTQKSHAHKTSAV